MQAAPTPAQARCPAPLLSAMCWQQLYFCFTSWSLHLRGGQAHSVAARPSPAAPSPATAWPLSLTKRSVSPNKSPQSWVNPSDVSPAASAAELGLSPKPRSLGLVQRCWPRTEKHWNKEHPHPNVHFNVPSNPHCDPSRGWRNSKAAEPFWAVSAWKSTDYNAGKALIPPRGYIPNAPGDFHIGKCPRWFHSIFTTACTRDGRHSTLLITMHILKPQQLITDLLHFCATASLHSPKRWIWAQPHSLSTLILHLF